MTSLFPEYDKIIYLDGDTVAVSDISDMYDLNFNDHYLLGHSDSNGIYWDKKVIGETDFYMNSGVMLCNLKKMREDDIEEKLIEFYKEHNGNLNCGDQTPYFNTFYG